MIGTIPASSKIHPSVPKQVTNSTTRYILTSLLFCTVCRDWTSSLHVLAVMLWHCLSPFSHAFKAQNQTTKAAIQVVRLLDEQIQSLKREQFKFRAKPLPVDASVCRNVTEKSLRASHALLLVTLQYHVQCPTDKSQMNDCKCFIKG